MDQLADKAHILLVDDRPDSLLAMKTALADLGQNIVTAASGEEALRLALRMEFAAILLDVHMPRMDGLETARILRQRRSSRDTPIIFVTGYADELHISRGYELGAVDYILAPVKPEVLRAKVSVFVDLFRKNRQVRAQAESLRQRADQLQKLALASVQINAARSPRPMLQTITDAARDILDAHQAITLFFGEPGAGPAKPLAVSSFSEQYADWQDHPLDLTPVMQTVVACDCRATRLTEDELRQHPDWDIVSSLELPPVCGGMIAAPLTGQEGVRLGVLYVAHAFHDAEFTGEDEHILVQLAQIASIAIENILSAEAREANRLKDDFLATLSHELRTPLNAMLGWIRLLRAEKPDQELLDTGLEVIDRNVDAQTRLIEDLLDISRITSGKLHLTRQRTALEPILQAAVEAIRPEAETQHITLEARLPSDSMDVIGDADRLQQVFWNLLANAIKFTPEGGRVMVTLGQDEGEAWIEIHDSGEGIAADLLPHIFDRFRQAAGNSTRRHGGLGVGLALVRHIVQMHGGTTHARSEGEGRGSTFTVRLPLSEHDVQADSAVAVEAEAAEDTSAAIAGVRVLVVDDESDTRDMLDRIIRRHGGEAVLAASVAEALKAMHDWRPDVLLSDIAMPERDGYALVQTLRARPELELRTLPAIALTAYARRTDRERALEVGFDRHVAKPVEPTQLVAALAECARPRCPDRQPGPAIAGDTNGRQTR